VLCKIKQHYTFLAAVTQIYVGGMKRFHTIAEHSSNHDKIIELIEVIRASF